MKVIALSAPLVMGLAGCVGAPYAGQSVLVSGDALVCGVHRTVVESNEGYRFDGLISGTEDFEFAARRFPNTLGPNFGDEFHQDLGYTIPFTDYTCDGCYEGHARLEKIPMWYKRLVGGAAEARQDRQLRRAVAKAERSGNSEGVRDSDLGD
ncbi:MAG: hypothetical protein ACR2RV_02460 [Verrucomicrobiales bacterium]